MMTTAGFADREQGKRCLSRHHIGGSRPAARWLLWGRMVTNCWRRHCRIEPKGVTRTQQSGGLVARAGIDRPEVTLPLLAGLTPRWSSEGAVRPFIQRHPDLTYEHLHRWVADRDEHVRRLVSEGTRPRLPWASQLRQLMADPTPSQRQPAEHDPQHVAGMPPPRWPDSPQGTGRPRLAPLGRPPGSELDEERRRGRIVTVHQVDVDAASQQPRRLEFDDPDRDQQTLLAGRIVDDCLLPGQRTGPDTGRRGLPGADDGLAFGAVAGGMVGAVWPLCPLGACALLPSGAFGLPLGWTAGPFGAALHRPHPSGWLGGAAFGLPVAYWSACTSRSASVGLPARRPPMIGHNG
jgi:hypothetical protein